jgi:hypothetical protein
MTNTSVARRRPRVVRPAAALAAGVLILVMLACGAVLSSAAHQFRPSDLGQIGLWPGGRDLLSTVDRALEPAYVTVWTAATASRPG